jgi:copper chaperone CopZ
MKSETFLVDNVKCSGCVNSIRNKIGDLNGVQSVAVEMKSGTVQVDYDGELSKSEIMITLAKIGYPVKA